MKLLLLMIYIIQNRKNIAFRWMLPLILFAITIINPSTGFALDKESYFYKTIRTLDTFPDFMPGSLQMAITVDTLGACLLYTSPSPRD